MALAPQPTRRVEDEAATHQHLHESMPTAREVGSNVLAAAAKVPDSLLLRRRRRNGREHARSVQLSELPCVSTIGLDPLPWLHRNQRRRDDFANHLSRSFEPTLERISARTSLVT